MDREEALTLLKSGEEGILAWNRHREKGGEIPSLQGAHLNGAELSGARLDGADLSGARLNAADLTEADLTGARLTGARFYGAELTRADLSGARLTWADLYEVHLKGARLDGASLDGTRIFGAHLDGTSFKGAICLATSFVNVDFSGSLGLDDVRHDGPSSIGVDSLFRSKGQIPEAFLRGCGVPDALIQYLPSLIGSMSPIQFYSCFISHSSKDAEFAARLHSRMTQEKLRVWYAPEDMKGGLKILDQIDHAIRVHDKLLLVLSGASMGSDWVRHEVVRAVERERAEGRQILFPIALVNHEAIRSWAAFDADLGRDMAKVVREYHIPDFSGWKDHDAFEGSFARLLDDLKSRDVPRPA